MGGTRRRPRPSVSSAEFIRNAARPITVGLEAGGLLGAPRYQGTRFFPDRNVPRVLFNARVPGGLDFALNVPERVLADPTTGEYFQAKATGAFSFTDALSGPGTTFGDGRGPLDLVATQGPNLFPPLAGIPTFDLDLFDFSATRGDPRLGYLPSLSGANVFALANPSFQNVAQTGAGFYGPRALAGDQLSAIGAIVAK